MAAEAGPPRAIFINKFDRERASFERTLEGLIATFGNAGGPRRRKRRATWEPSASLVA
jgi:hypothetical protein